jgi:hypothetical protein
MSVFDSETHSNSGASRPGYSRRESSYISKKFATAGSSKLSGVVQGLQRQSNQELTGDAFTTLLNTDHAAILEWIATERMSHLPPEGSSYDKVLAWAQLFVERLHSFDVAIRDFEGSSWLAAKLSYGYCAMLLEVGDSIQFNSAQYLADPTIAWQGECPCADGLFRLLLQHVHLSGEPA